MGLIMKRVINGTLKQFDVLVENRVGALADACELLAENAINIRAIATSDLKGGKGVLRIVTEDENTTKIVLGKSRFGFEEHDILNLKLMDRPGELAKVARMLAKENINIESVFILGKNNGYTEIAFKVDKMGLAKQVLR